MALPSNMIKAKYLTSTIPGYSGNRFVEALPPVLKTKGLKDGLTGRMVCEKKDWYLDGTTRAHIIAGVMDQFFQPLTNHVSLEQKLSVLIRKGYVGRNYNNGWLKQRLQDGYERLRKGELDVQVFSQAPSTATSFALIGGSGCGKSMTLNRILATYPQVIFHEEINFTQVVYLKMDCPHDGTLKNLCIDFFRAMDRVLGQDYETKYGQKRHTIETLLSLMAQVANAHGLGVLVIDEIQHLNTAKSGGVDKMLNFFVTLVNVIGVPVLFVGTPKAKPIFLEDFRSARRTTGIGSLFWGPMKGDSNRHSSQERKEWIAFTDKLWKLQWLQMRDELLSEELREVWFELSQGIHDIVVKLFVLAQLRAIATKTERITEGLLRQVYNDELKPVHPMLEALRANDADRILRYSDLYLEDADVRVLKLSNHIDAMTSEKERTENLYDGNPKAQRLHNMLIALDMDSKLLPPLIKRVMAEHPNAAIADLMQVVLSWKKEEIKKSIPATRKQVYVRQKDWNQLATEDLRYQHSQSSGDTLMYGLLKKQGTVFDLHEWIAV